MRGLPLPAKQSALPKQQMKKESMAAVPATYADAGVDITAGDRAKRRIKMLAQKTFTKNVLGGVGGFGGLFHLDPAKYSDPVLVSSADGVGTKLKVAFQMGIHNSVGADLVNHCVNDIAVQGATPLFFMDYLATGEIHPGVVEEVVGGIARACKANGCALIGGETAQMPGFYADGEYDLAGFIVGVVEKSRVITGAAIQPGDVLIGLPSTGLHTNGYSLARRLLFEVAGYAPQRYVSAIKEKAGTALMQTHRSYLSILRKLTAVDLVAGMAHITGGGITENLPRILPKGTAAVVELGSWPVPPLFTHLQELGAVAQDEMLRTFNMGIGMVVVVSSDNFRRTRAVLERAREPFFVIGNVVRGTKPVVSYR